MNLQTLIANLHAWLACEPSLAWVRSLPSDTTPAQAWELCPRADWLLWLMAKTELDPRRIVFAACVCAERALSVLPSAETRPRRAIEAARMWCAEEGSQEEVALALDGAREAFYDAPNGSRAESAAHAVALAAEPPCVGWAAAVARAPARAAEAIAGRRCEDVEAELARMADLVRMHVPWAAVEERLAEVLS